MKLRTKYLGIAEIADLAGASKSRVCNWRDRYDTFPTPIVILKMGSIYDAEEIIDWLLKTRRLKVGRV